MSSFLDNDSEESLRYDLRYFDAYQLQNQLDEWRKKREDLIEELEDLDELDMETYWRMVDEIYEVETLSLHLDMLSRLLDLEVAPIRKRLDKFAEEHDDEF